MTQTTMTRTLVTPAMRLRANRVILYAVVLFLCVLFGFPLFWTLMSSLKTPAEMFAFPPPLVPAEPQWANYYNVLVIPRIPVIRWALNSTIVVVLATAGTLVTASLVAYSFARFEYRGRDALFLITLATMMLPAQVTLIPQFVLFHKLGWINTLLPLWVPYWFGGGGFAIFLMRQFFLSLPRDLDEAALIDGASFFRIFWSILLPLCKPVLATLGIITIIATWSDFLGPLIYLNSPEKFTVSVGLQFFNNSPEVGGEPMQHLLMAACILSMLPVIIIFFLGQRFFVQGIVMSGIKG
ncbi:carbohydrate ABC transporter permease [Litorilinea aerophila]|uniref:Carbohydrate ABC transporter permease n=1 Tax=Litorilinea aerophila TaxID=1204385 RepID=A0A540VIK0_9CHLR|nr:carbohydrate ABC transporter permease [Litorilinea aerophila]MCC9075759.1 carbohydrate ABC transporter permease [Litorilinea aerophila]GIV77313.1 MAG: sn-glycerol-3-phosphate transport system permease protein UgpE [Litorilinea sp.]